jgi:hypothetical protein
LASRKTPQCLAHFGEEQNQSAAESHLARLYLIEFQRAFYTKRIKNILRALSHLIRIGLRLARRHNLSLLCILIFNGK